MISYDIEAAAGETLTFDAALKDSETGTVIPEADVSWCVVYVGDNRYTLADDEVDAVTNAIRVSLPGAVTELLSGVVRVHIKVGLTDGREEELTPDIGSLIKFTKTPATADHS